MKSRRAFIYLFISKFIKSFLGFGLYVLILVPIIYIYGHLTESAFADSLFGSSGDWTTLLMPLLIATVVASVMYALTTTLTYIYTKKIELLEDGVEVTSGLLFKKVDLIPYSKIKYIESKHSPLQRLMHFASVSIDYGGWTLHTIDYVPDEKVQKLEDKLAHGI